MAAVSCRSHKDAQNSSTHYEPIYFDEIYDKPQAKDDVPVDDNDGSFKELMAEIDRWLGTPYKYGGHSLEGTDCSGMVMEVFREVYGINLPHHSADILSEACDLIDACDLGVGDLVFFSFVKSGRISHVGIYVGDGKFVHSSSSRGVIVSDMHSPYYERGYVASGRLRELNRVQDGSLTGE